MLPYLFAVPLMALSAPLQVAEPSLSPIPLTATQKAMFDAFSKAGIRRLVVKGAEKEDDRYVEVRTPGDGATFAVYVSPKRTSISVSIDFDSSGEGTYDRFEKLVKAKFPDIEVDEGIFEDAYLSRTIATQDLTEKWATGSLDLLGKASLLQKEASKSAPASQEPASTDPIGKTLKTVGYTTTLVGPFHRIRITFTDSKRAQNVFVRQSIWEYNSLKVQEVYSTFYESPEPPSDALLQKMSQKFFNIGGVVLERPSEQQKLWRMRFRIDAPIDIAPDRLKIYISLAAGTADSLEREIDPNKEDTL